MRHKRITPKTQLFLFYFWQGGDRLGWAVMSDAEAYIARQNCTAGQRWAKVEFYGYC